MTLGLGFLNPMLLWALPLAAVPIIIHLLNRRRFDRRPWAAMEFLLRAMKRNRRRLRMEHWIILFLRTLAILLLVMLVSRPQLSDNVLGTARTHHVVIVDDSASLAQRGGADSAFDRAIDSTRELVASLTRGDQGDAFTLMRSSKADLPAMAAVPVTPDLPGRVREELAGWRVGDGALDPARVLTAASTRAAETEGIAATRYYVITDLRRVDWVTAEGKTFPAIDKWLQSFGEFDHLSVFDVGDRNGENLAITDVRCASRVCVVGVPTTLEVEITNRGRTTTERSTLNIGVDEQSSIVNPVPPLPPGESTTITVEQTFHSVGWHGVTAELPADRFATDDRRSLALEVRPASQVLLIDGDPGEDLEESETYFLNIALDPGGETMTGIEVRTIGDQELGSLPDADLAAVDLICICNVSRPDDQSIARLEQFAREGGGVIVFLGNQIDGARYNTALWKDGRGLLPAAVVDVDGDMDDPRPVHLSAPDHELFERNTEQLDFMLKRIVHVGRWIGFDVDAKAESDVLLRVGDAEGPVLMVGKTFEEGGRVYAFGTSADAHWTDLPIRPVFPIIVQEIHATAARPQDFGSTNLSPTDKFTIQVDPGVYRPDITVAPFAGDGDTITVPAPSPDGEPVDAEIDMSAIDGHGLFEVQRRAHAGTTDVTLVARNPLLREGMLDSLSRSQLTSGMPDELRNRVSVMQGSDVASMQTDSGAGGLWRWLGLVMLIGLLLETLLAWRFGRR